MTRKSTAKTPAANIQDLNIGTLRRLVALWRVASEQNTGNTRSTYHRWYMRAYLELQRREASK